MYRDIPAKAWVVACCNFMLHTVATCNTVAFPTNNESAAVPLLYPAPQVSCDTVPDESPICSFTG